MSGRWYYLWPAVDQCGQ
ncbi:hypothetical protein [uncultured Roseobacter sp.]